MALRDRERDPELPGLAGEANLRPPSTDELLELVAAHMRLPGASAPVAARWDYARWKPGVSISSVFMLRFADGAEEPLVAKRYVDGKDRTLKPRRGDAERLEGLSTRLVSRAVLTERSLSLWVPAADRVLRGVPALLDRRALGNLVTRSGIAPHGAVKKRKTEYTLLRYKPERRAVYRLDLRLRGEDRPKLALAARVLPPAEAARVIGARAALAEAGAGELVVPVAATNLRQGFLLEPWLELASFAPETFAHAREAGALLARLHARAPRALVRRITTGLPGDLDALFSVDPRLARAPRAQPHPAPERALFCHGDFHPDQVVRRASGAWLLLDLDLLGAGDPDYDLACWIADWIVERQQVELAPASSELLDGYRAAGGRAPEPARLAAFVAAELVCRAGSTLRRLEKGAVEKALFALDAAQRIGGGGS